jgi:integrase
MDVTARTIDQAVGLGSYIYHQHRLRDQGEGRFGMRLTAHPAGPMVVGTLQYGGPVRIDCAEFVDSYQVNVSQRLGHASPVVTMTVYAHVLPGSQREAADRFAALVGRGGA